MLVAALVVVLQTIAPPSPGSAISYSVDSQGNTTQRGSDRFSWNGEEELTSGSIGGQSFGPQYTGDGLRANRTIGSTTSFVWGYGNVLDDGTQYVYALGWVEHVISTGTYYVLTDGLDSTVALVDSSGTVQQGYGYDVYGNATASSGSQPTEYQYDGQQTDSAGLQYLRSRYYDPSSGRFLSRDPSAGCDFNPATHNPYVYASANRVTKVDPSGQDTVQAGGQSYGDMSNLDQFQEDVATLLRTGVMLVGLKGAPLSIAYDGDPYVPYPYPDLAEPYGDARKCTVTQKYKVSLSPLSVPDAGGSGNLDLYYAVYTRQDGTVIGTGEVSPEGTTYVDGPAISAPQPTISFVPSIPQAY